MLFELILFVCCVCSRFVQVIVSGINPIDLVISSPELIFTNCSSVKATPMHSSAECVSIKL